MPVAPPEGVQDGLPRGFAVGGLTGPRLRTGRTGGLLALVARPATPCPARPTPRSSPSRTRPTTFGSSYLYCTTQNAAIDPSQCHLRPVGTFALTTSPCGAFDMNGSAWEISAPGPSASTNIRIRGGAWTSIASYLKGTYDNGTVPYSTASNVGFRLAAPGL